MTGGAVFAPARVNLIGEHTDYSGGLVLPVAIDLGTTVAWEPRDGLVRVRSLAFGDAVEIGADGSGEAAGWGRYVAAVVALLHERGRRDVGIDAVVSSTVPIGSGLSSSAALTVSLALALCRAAAFELEPLELARLMRGGGVTSGRRSVRADGPGLCRCSPAAATRCSSTAAARSTATFRSRRASPSWSSTPACGTRSSTPATPSGAPRSSAATRAASVTSSPRTNAFGRSWRRSRPGNVDALGPLFRAGHDSLRDDFEVSTPELDLLVDLAYEHGAVAARMTGGGFGGSIVVLADVRGARALADSVGAAYRERTGRDGRSYVCESVDGAAA